MTADPSQARTDPVTLEVIPAGAVDRELARQIAVVLGRAFTDDRHVGGFSAERQAEWADAIQRCHAALPAEAPLMPASFLRQFPALRNFVREPSGRREALHVIARETGFVACHVAIFGQRFEFEGSTWSGIYIEDVATDPTRLGRGLASAAMRRALDEAQSLGAELAGLATGIAAFYERLGWQTWSGDHLMYAERLPGERRDTPLMLFPLAPTSMPLLKRSGLLRSWRLWRLRDLPDPG